MEVSPSCTYYNDCALYLLKVVEEAMFQAVTIHQMYIRTSHILILLSHGQCGAIKG